MLRINLLPSYVAQRRLNKRLIAGFGALFVLLGVGLLAWDLSIAGQVKSETSQADQAVAGQQVTQGIQAQATSETSQIQPITDKVNFVKAVHLYNLAQAKLYATMADYSNVKGIVYTDASYSGNIMTMKAYTPSFQVLVKYLQRIRQDPQFTQVVVDHVPSYGDAYLTEYFLGHTLVSIGTPPGGQGGSGQGGYPGSTGFGAGAGGYPGGGSMGGGYPGGGGYPSGGGGPMGSGYPGGSGGTGPQYGQTTITQKLAASQAVTPLQKIIQSHISPLALPRQAAEAAVQLREDVYSKRVPQGFFFTVTATLKTPLTPPAVPGSGGAAGGAAGSPMGGPPMGGYPGGGGPPTGGYPGGVQTASAVGTASTGG